MTGLHIDSRSEADTERFGNVLAQLLPDSAVVGLIGTLGAGKTRLVQAVARANGDVDRQAVSPTFVLVNEYEGQRPIYHFDVYRLARPEELLDLGPEEYFSGGGLTLIEWADRVADWLPDDRIEIAIGITGPTSRRFELRSPGGHHGPLLRELVRQMEGA